MATAVVARPVARPQARARDEEVLVWPDLVFVEFIAALIFSIALLILSFAINAPLLDEANADVTTNPSKAPWYLLNLQELLLHMNPAMAGVIIPTIWLVLLGAFPYFDRDTDGQGVWFGTENAVKITIASAAVGFAGTWALILWNAGKVAQALNQWFGFSGGDALRWLADSRSIQTQLPWPEWSRSITYIPFEVKILGDDFQHLDFPAWLVEQGIPTAFMVGMSSMLIYGLWRLGWVNNRRDALLALFSGFIGAYGVLTLAGTAFRGEGQNLVFPWDLSLSEGIPGETAHSE